MPGRPVQDPVDDVMVRVVDKQGMVYLTLKRAGRSHGYTGAAERNATGTIVKIDPRTRRTVPACHTYAMDAEAKCRQTKCTRRVKD
jgi:hypothetical protein